MPCEEIHFLFLLILQKNFAFLKTSDRFYRTFTVFKNCNFNNINKNKNNSDNYSDDGDDNFSLMNEENFVKESIQKDLHARITEKNNNVVVEKSFENLEKFLIAKNNKKTVDLLKNWQDRGLKKLEKSKTVVDKNSMLANCDQILSSSLLLKNKNFEYKLNYELNIDTLNKNIIIENNIKRNNYLKTLDLYKSKKFFQSVKLSKIKKSGAENATMNRFASILESIENNEVKSVNKCENNSLNGESILSLDDEKNKNIEKKIVQKTIIKDEDVNVNNNIINNNNNNNNKIRKQSVIKLNDANVDHETEFKNIFKNYKNLNLLENNANFFNVFKCLRENIFKNLREFGKVLLLNLQLLI
jgi:hypothetical protein